ncbi:MAG: hypothetical protein HC918_00220 [Oscillatoriales cyanobacterium SM2_1_8]|nr:hypothetical protein [Oscillatoriales cyanobacterium SM2_1_8]
MLKQITADIAELEGAIAAVDDRLQVLEKAYLQSICQSARQQLWVAAYRLCTQVHPQEFLGLSVRDREQVQNQLRAIAEGAVVRCQGLMVDSETGGQGGLGDALEEKLGQVLTEATTAIAQDLRAAGVLPDDKGAHPLHLRVADVEFGDRVAMAYRSEMRVVRARRHHLGDELVKKHRQKLVAEAELAWRATWVEP